MVAKNRISFFILILALVSLVVAVPTFAQEGEDGDSSLNGDTSRQKNREEALKSQRDELRKTIEEKRTALKSRLDAARETHKQRLEGSRLALCEKRETKINDLISKSTTVGQKRLASIQHVESRVNAFVLKKELTSAEIDAAVQVANEKEAVAVEAVKAMGEAKYECGSVDAERPSHFIKTVRDERHTALSAYRTAVKDLIHKVKQEFATTQSGKESTDEQ